MIYSIITFIFEILSSYLLADFLTGLFHWFKDTYFSPHTPVIGLSLIWPSRLHHIKPRYIMEFSDWDIIRSSAWWTLMWFGPIFYFFGLSIFNLSLFAFISINDVIHKYSHATESDTPAAITFLQNIGIIQVYDEHHIHHIEPYAQNYCVMTPYINIWVEKINLWRLLENMIEWMIHVKPRVSVDDYVEDLNYPAGIKFV